MMVRPRPDERILARRARYFFTTDRRARSEVRAFGSMLSGMGECAVVGGMPRDLCLGGNRAFRSDVDFVADVADLPAFDCAMAALGATVNRFGGYGVALDNWRVDVWPLRRTWAAREGHARVEGCRDVLGTTFFNWDAVLYFPATGEVAAKPGYFGDLGDRRLDVNLLPNPNPLGNAVRALRHACAWRARIAPALADHVSRQISAHGWEGLVRAEAASFATRYLTGMDPDDVARRLRSAVAGGSAVALIAGSVPTSKQGFDCT